MKDVARRAGVAVGTVSNVLNQPERVTPATRRRVLTAIDELGFVRNESARQLRAGRSHMVGLVVLDMGNPFFTDVARGAESVLRGRGAALVVCDSADQPARETLNLSMLEEQRVQGVLLSPTGDPSAQVEAMIARGMPVVLVDHVWPRGGGCSVTVDDVRGGELAAVHLLEQGHRRIGFVGGPLTLGQVAGRLRGARQATAGVAGPSQLLTVLETMAMTLAEGQRVGKELAGLPVRSRPTALFCANDLLAIGVLQSLIRHGLRVPHDIALVGYDDIAYAAAAAVPLSSVGQPRELIGRTAAELLLNKAADGGRHQHEQIAYEPELVIRESSLFRRRLRRSA